MEDSNARPSTCVSMPRAPDSPCTGLGVPSVWFPVGNPRCAFFHCKVSLMVTRVFPWTVLLYPALLVVAPSLLQVGPMVRGTVWSEVLYLFFWHDVKSNTNNINLKFPTKSDLTAQNIKRYCRLTVVNCQNVLLTNGLFFLLWLINWLI